MSRDPKPHVEGVPHDEPLSRALEAARQAAGVLEHAEPLHDAERTSARLAALRERVDQAILAETGTVAALRALSVRAQLVVSVLVMGVATAVVFLFLPRADLARNRLLAIAVSAALATMSFVLVVRCCRPLHQPELRRSTSASLLFAGVMLAAAIALVRRSEPSFGGAFASECASCIGLGAALALPGLLFVLATRRHAHAEWTVPLIAGAAAGIFAQGVLELHCPLGGRAHHTLGHFALVPLLAVVAYAAAMRFNPKLRSKVESREK
ncbi:MAG: DUF1109 family protein [Myxococcales bacterium]|nr:DUF1109 family protein [Myxococcales bacterium]